MNLAARLLAAIICLALGIIFFGDVLWGWEDQPHSRAYGVASLVFTSALLALILFVNRHRPKSN